MAGDKQKPMAKLKIESVKEYRKDAAGNKYLAREYREGRWVEIKKEGDK
jgi:hypothetical protein